MVTLLEPSFVVASMQGLRRHNTHIDSEINSANVEPVYLCYYYKHAQNYIERAHLLVLSFFPFDFFTTLQDCFEFPTWQR